jgi:hypothetical protein
MRLPFRRRKDRVVTLFSSAVLFGLFSPIAVSDAKSSAIERATNSLEERQRTLYTQLGWRPKHYSRDELEKINQLENEQLLATLATFPGITKSDIDHFRTRLAERNKALGEIRLPTPYEDPFSYQVIRIAATQIDAAVKEFQKADSSLPDKALTVPEIVFGTLPTGEVDASTELVNPRDDQSQHVYLVIFETGFFKFAQAFSDIVARAIPTSKDGKFQVMDLNRTAVEKHLDVHPEIVADFEALMRAYLIQGGPYVSATYRTPELPEPYATLSGFLYRSALVFALGHEYGHVMFSENDLTVNTRLPMGWSEEYFADGWGVTLSMLTAGRNTNLEMTIFGARFFLSCFDMIERGISVVSTGQDSYRAKTRHPPAEKRKEKIPRYVLSTLRRLWNIEPDSPEKFDRMLGSTANIDIVLGTLWERIEPDLLKLHNQGARLAPSWSILTPRQH